MRRLSLNGKILLQLLAVPLTFFVIYLLFIILWKFLHLPSDQELLPIVKGYFYQHGLWVIFFSSLIEGFLFLGQYFPGGFVIFLGIIAAGHSIPRAVETVLVVSAAFFIAYSFNYWTGKYGWYRLFMKFGLGRSLEEAKEKLRKQEFNAILFSYWEPNLASLIATAAGVLNIPLKRFSIFSAFGILIWGTFWGALIFYLGDDALKIVGLKYAIIIFCLWVVIIIAKHVFFQLRQSHQKGNL